MINHTDKVKEHAKELYIACPIYRNFSKLPWESFMVPLLLSYIPGVLKFKTSTYSRADYEQTVEG